jgi:tRNA(Ile2) C34 agmatinyltransferase TiaS
MSWCNFMGGDGCPDCGSTGGYQVSRGVGASLIYRCDACGEEYRMVPDSEYQRELAVERQIDRALEEARA